MWKPFFDFPEATIKKFNFYFEYIVDTKTKTEKIIQHIPFIGKFVDNGKKIKNTNQPLLDVEIKENITNLIYEGNWGTSLCEFLNNFNAICNLLDNSYDIIKKSSTKLESTKNIDILQLELVKDLNSSFKRILPQHYTILQTTIDSFYHFYDKSICDYITKLNYEIQLIEKTNNPIDSYETSQYPLKEMKDQLTKMHSLDFYKEECLEFITDFKLLLQTLQNLADNSFVQKAEKSHTTLFTGTKLNIPKATITYNANKHPKPAIYAYDFYEIHEFVDISLYQLSISKNVIVKCNNCEDYFIPQSQNDEIYCDKVFKNGKTCKEIGKSKSFSQKQAQERPYDKLKKVITDRLRNNKKYKELYLDDFNNQYNLIYSKYIENPEKQNIEIHKFLTKYDMEFQKKHPLKKGKPYSSQQYWYKK